MTLAERIAAEARRRHDAAPCGRTTCPYCAEMARRTRRYTARDETGRLAA